MGLYEKNTNKYSKPKSVYALTFTLFLDPFLDFKDIQSFVDSVEHLKVELE